MRFALFILIFISCNSNKETANTIKVDVAFDSLQKATDSFNKKLLELDTLASSTSIAYEQTYSEMKVLRQEKKALIKQLEQKYPNFQDIKSDDENLKKIDELNKRLAKYEFDLARLRRDSANRYRPIKTNEPRQLKPDYIETPDNNSIVINLDGRSKNGNLPIDRLVIYLIPYNNKPPKQYMKYETSCDDKLYRNQRADYYNGQYFFNEVKPGKYLIKICTYYGNYRLIDKGVGKYNISMQVAPPIQ